jgi:L-ascorbate 6-phosphate lactonase
LLQTTAIRTGKALIREINETRVPYGMLAVWFLGQESVVVKGGDHVIYIDPYLSTSPHRSFEPPLSGAEVTNANVVLITHEHMDHMDLDTLSEIAANGGDAVYMAPGYCLDAMAQAGVPSDKLLHAKTNEWTLLEGFRVKPLPAAHEELEFDAELDHRYVGYVLDINGVTFYHAGDTTVYPGLIEALRSEAIELGMLPINGRDPFRNARNIIGNMNFREAAELAVAAGFDTVVPLHYDMFAGNAEKPGYFVDYLYEHYPHQRCHVMARFERYIYVSEKALS